MSEEITVDFICQRCGHNLRRLQSDGNCGECGVAIARSIDALERKPLWTPLRRFSFGAAIICLFAVALANILIVGPANLGGMWTNDAAALFQMIWGVILFFWLAATICLAFARRLPMAFWILSWITFMLGVAAYFANTFIKVIAMASV